MSYIELHISCLLLVIPVGLILIMWQELSVPVPFYIKKRLIAIKFSILWITYKLYRAKHKITVHK